MKVKLLQWLWKRLKPTKTAVGPLTEYDQVDVINPVRLTSMFTAAFRERLDVIEALRFNYPVLTLEESSNSFGFQGMILRQFGNASVSVLTDSPYGVIDASNSTVDNSLPNRKEYSITFSYVPVVEETYTVKFNFSTVGFPTLDVMGPKIQYRLNDTGKYTSEQLKAWVRSVELMMFDQIEKAIKNIIDELPAIVLKEKTELRLKQQLVYESVKEDYISHYGPVDGITEEWLAQVITSIDARLTGMSIASIQELRGQAPIGLSQQRHGYFYYELNVEDKVLRIPILACNHTPFTHFNNRYISTIDVEFPVPEETYVLCKQVEELLSR